MHNQVDHRSYEKKGKLQIPTIHEGADARKIQKFLSQPFHVAENFTGIKGVYVPLKETIRGFKAILDGEMDEYPENAFFNAGTIEDVRKKAEQMEQNA